MISFIIFELHFVTSKKCDIWYAKEKIIEKVLKLSNNSYHNGSEDDINKSRLQQVIKLLTNYVKKNNSSVIVSFHTYNKFKNELIEECIEFNKTQSYFQNKEVKLYQLLELSKDNDKKA